MRVKNWSIIEESNPSTILEPGGYVCRITGVKDVPEKEYLWIMYDVAEGEKAGIYSGMGADDEWKHRFTRSYKESAEGMFKAFLNRLEESNKMGPRPFSVSEWQVYSDERQLVGLEIGLVFGKELYTTERGEDKERTVVSGVYASQDIRGGNYRVPEPKDRRTQVSNAPAPTRAAAYDNSPVPFN